MIAQLPRNQPSKKSPEYFPRPSKMQYVSDATWLCAIGDNNRTSPNLCLNSFKLLLVAVMLMLPVFSMPRCLVDLHLMPQAYLTYVCTYRKWNDDDQQKNKIITRATNRREKKWIVICYALFVFQRMKCKQTHKGTSWNSNMQQQQQEQS